MSARQFIAIRREVYDWANLSTSVEDYAARRRISGFVDACGNSTTPRVLDLRALSIVSLPDHLYQLPYVIEVLVSFANPALISRDPELADRVNRALGAWCMARGLSQANRDARVLASKAIAECVIAKRGVLNLSSLSLTEFPFGRLEGVPLDHISEVNIRNNLFTHIPDFLSRCPQLHSLNVRDNLIRDVSIELSTWAHTHALILNGNPLNPETQALIAWPNQYRFNHAVKTKDYEEDSPTNAFVYLSERYNQAQVDALQVFVRDFTTRASDFGDPIYREIAHGHLADILIDAASDLDLFSALVAHVDDVTCADGNALQFSNMELTHHLWRLGQGKFGPAHMIEVGQQYYRKSLLERYVEDLLEVDPAFSGSDVAEQQLAFLLQLREPLVLPKLGVHSMIFNITVRATREHYEAASNYVRSASKDASGFRDFLADWAPWQTQIQGKTATYCETQLRQCHADLARLVTLRELGGINERDYLLRTTEISVRYSQAEQMARRQATDKLLASHDVVFPDAGLVAHAEQGGGVSDTESNWVWRPF